MRCLCSHRSRVTPSPNSFLLRRQRRKDSSVSLRGRIVSAPPGSTSASRSCRRARMRSEEHTSELQSHVNLVCRLLLEKKKKNKKILITVYIIIQDCECATFV